MSTITTETYEVYGNKFQQKLYYNSDMVLYMTQYFMGPNKFATKRHNQLATSNDARGIMPANTTQQVKQFAIMPN
jgi:hypothetical protein